MAFVLRYNPPFTLLHWFILGALYAHILATETSC
jgi:hypothetical protein